MTKAMRSLTRLFPILAFLCLSPLAAQAAGLSGDLYSFQLSVAGELIHIPSTYQQLQGSGWSYGGSEDELLRPEQRAACVWEKNGIKLKGEMVNTSWDVRPVKDCTLAAVTVQTPEAALPGDILLGVSRAEEVVNAYGVPTGTYEDSDSFQYTYRLDYNQEALFTFASDTGELRRVSLRNVVMDAAPDPAALAVQTPAAQEPYQAPEDLGEDPLSFRVAFGGALYALPAPVPEFVKNGWALSGGADSVVKAYGSGQLTLSQNGQSFTTWVYNPSSTAALARDCLVTTVASDMGKANIPLTLPGGVTTGMNEEEALQILGSLPVTESETDSQRRYTVVNGQATVILSVMRGTGVISRVEVNSTPAQPQE